MSADAIVAFRPKDPDKLKPFLDLDDDASDDELLYAEVLEDGTMLVHTFQPFEIFEENPAEAHAWLAQFGDALPDVHDDPRGFFFYPDSLEPEATTYDALLDEVGSEGIFFEASASAAAEEGDFDLGALGQLAEQLLGGAAPQGSFEIGKLLGDMQQHVAHALGVHAENDDTVDEEFESDETPPKPTPAS